VPAGTGNVFAAEIGLGRDPDAIADLLLNGPVHKIGGAQANGETFFLMAGVGFDGEVVKHLDVASKQRVGKLAYAAPIMRALLKKPRAMRVTADEKRLEAQWMVAARARNYGGSFEVSPSSGLCRPGFELILLKGPSRRAVARQALAVALGANGNSDGVVRMRCSRIRVEADEPVAVQVDGDTLGLTPITLEDGGPPLHVIVPKTYAASAH
jgi:diacylglycerol kinase family enzyme